MDRGSNNKHSSQGKRNVSLEDSSNGKDICGGSLLLMNPNASEDGETSPSLTKKNLTATNSLPLSDSKEKIASNKSSNGNTTSKFRPKSPSFFKMLVGGLRKISTQEEDSSKVESLSDTEELTFSSPHHQEVDERQRIEHFATLPRNKDLWKQQNNEEVAHFNLKESYSLEENKKTENSVPDKSSSPSSLNKTNNSESPTLDESLEHHSFGLDALEMLHNQLQILVRQDCDEEMADKMENKVIETLQKQISDLQQSLECLQQSDQSLRMSLKMAEMRAQEAEIKLHHSSDRCHKLERDCRWLETEFKILYQKYHEMQKHLQKKAILHQISLEQRSPTKSSRRPASTQNNHRSQRGSSFDSNLPVSPVKRHNSSEVLYQQQQKTHHHHRSHSQHHRNNMSSPTSSLPASTGRVHSGSHTETRV